MISKTKRRLSAATASAALMIGAMGIAHADIVSTVGLTQIPAPAIVNADFAIHAGLPPQLIFPEQQNVTLAAPLVTDTGTIAAGTIVSSYFFAVNVSLIETIANTSVTFNGPVLGIVFKEDTTGLPSPNFAGSDFLGHVGTSYQESGVGCLFCAFEWLGQTDQQFNIDTATFSMDTASFHNFYSNPGDFARIITTPATAVPGPVVGAGLPGVMALLGFGYYWRRWRQTS